jgi:hypothetical protein
LRHRVQPNEVATARHRSSPYERTSPADTVIFLDLPAWACLRGIAQRRLRYVLDRLEREPGYPAVVAEAAAYAAQRAARYHAARGLHAQAETQFRRVLTARLRVLGADNPDTLITRHEIARLMADQGNYTGAEAESRDILAISQGVLGADHPETLITQHELARVIAAQGHRPGGEAEDRDV